MLRDPDLFRGRAPHPLGPRAYAADSNEVKAIGSTTSTTRTPDQTAAANYWGVTNATATIASIIRSVRPPARTERIISVSASGDLLPRSSIEHLARLVLG